MSAKQARAALDRDDAVTALKIALGRWRATRAPQIADAVEAIDRLARRSFVAPTARTKQAFDRAWVELARAADDPTATGWLAETLARRVPVRRARLLDRDYTERKYGALLARCALLARRGPDPRIARAFFDLLHDAPFSVIDERAAKLLYGPAIQHLVAQGDARQIERLEALARSPRAENLSVRTFLARRLPSAIKKLGGRRARPVEDLAQWRELVTRRGARPGGDPQRERQLLDAIYAAPDDREAKLVYADTLQARGDPRGEYIALSIAGKEHARCRTLLRRHRLAWLGDDLGRVLRKVAFHEGFLYEAELAQNAVAPAAAWQRAMQDPRLLTLRRLLRGRANLRHYTGFVGSACLQHLRNLEVSQWAVLDAVAGLSPAREISELRLLVRPHPQNLAKILDTPSLDALRSLGIRLWPAELRPLVDDLLRSRLLHRIDTLTVEPREHVVLEQGVVALFSLWPMLPPNVQRLSYRLGLGHHELRRGDGGLIATSSGWCADHQAAPLAPHLPATVTEYRVHPTDTLDQRSRDTLRRWARRRGTRLLIGDAGATPD